MATELTAIRTLGKVIGLLSQLLGSWEEEKEERRGGGGRGKEAGGEEGWREKENRGKGKRRRWTQ